jgi:hypothetical protein
VQATWPLPGTRSTSCPVTCSSSGSSAIQAE